VVIPTQISLSSSKSEITLFSIVVPTWNNLELAKNCVESIIEHSSFDHQIILVVNEGKDGTAEYFIKNQSNYKNLDIIHFSKNVGICHALNAARQYVRSTMISYANDDMYFLPKWDAALRPVIDGFEHEMWMVSSTMIEPTDTGNKCVLVGDYGRDIGSFDKSRLLSDYASFEKRNWSGSSWPPMVVPLSLWDVVGGLSIEFSPGMYSDPDFAIKCWKIGVRDFVGIGSSRVYHFGSKSTSKVKRNPGRQRFIQKWGISAGFFNRKMLKMGEIHEGKLPDYQLSTLESFLNLLKRIIASTR
jgi:glycosyltransferase involved in cell wall biosynthesis